MRDDIHIGDTINQSGAGSIGKIQYQDPAAQIAALGEMARLAMELRDRVGDRDRAIIDASAGVAGDGEHRDEGALRRAVNSLIAVATKAGAVGVPLLDAAIKVKTLCGL